MLGTRDVSSTKFPCQQPPVLISAWDWIATSSGLGERLIPCHNLFPLVTLLLIIWINLIDQSDTTFDRFAGSRGVETIPATETC